MDVGEKVDAHEDMCEIVKYYYKDVFAVFCVLRNFRLLKVKEPLVWSRMQIS